MRLANVFTAVADVWLGMILSLGSLQPAIVAGLLAAVSAMLYTAGMVLNDVFDAEQDAVERPERPIPSGRVSRRLASVIGWGLLHGGLLLAFLLAWIVQNITPAAVAWLLSVAIVFYNTTLKHTRFGPLGMAACRLLNVGIGLSFAHVQFDVLEFVWIGAPLLPAVGIAVYIAGVTWFSRQEHTTSSRNGLLVGTALVTISLGMLAYSPWTGFDAGLATLRLWQWAAIWLVLGCWILERYVAALRSPTPANVQRAVGHSILSLTLIDATVAWGFAGEEAAACIAALWIPAMLLSQRLRMT
jgi:4-hydroxybenzoate polyprenyltransferase